MIYKIGACLVIGLVLLASILDVLPRAAQAEVPDQDADRKAQSTRLMQQIDYQRRLRSQKEAEETQRQYSDMAVPLSEAEEESAAGFDLAVFVILAVSAVALFIVCRVRGRSARQCVFPPDRRSFDQRHGSAQFPKSN